MQKQILVIGMLAIVASIGLTAVYNNAAFAQHGQGSGCGAGGGSCKEGSSGYTGGYGVGEGGSNPAGVRGGGAGFGGLNPTYNSPTGDTTCGGGSGGAYIPEEDRYIGSGGGSSC